MTYAWYDFWIEQWMTMYFWPHFCIGNADAWNQDIRDYFKNFSTNSD